MSPLFGGITVAITPISLKTGHNQVSFIQRYLLLGSVIVWDLGQKKGSLYVALIGGSFIGGFTA